MQETEADRISQTTELTRLQVGGDTKDVRIIVSTVVEAEQLLPYLQDCQGEGKSVNVSISRVSRAHKKQ